MKVTYTATRPIVNNLNDVVALTFGVRSLTASKRRYGSQKRALDGTPYSQLDRIDSLYRVTTARLLEGGSLDNFNEFWESTANLETFSLDARDVGASVLARRTDKSASFRRIMRTDYVRVSFQVELI